MKSLKCRLQAEASVLGAGWTWSSCPLEGASWELLLVLVLVLDVLPQLLHVKDKSHRLYPLPVAHVTSIPGTPGF